MRFSGNLRRQIQRRAEGLCEYCGYPEKYSYSSYHIDHIRALKHNGTDSTSNLAYCCAPCNRSKGSNIATILVGEEKPTRLFNPRADAWAEHFESIDAEIIPLTPIGRATVELLNMNDVSRLIERQRIQKLETSIKTDD